VTGDEKEDKLLALIAIKRRNEYMGLIRDYWKN